MSRYVGLGGVLAALAAGAAPAVLGPPDASPDEGVTFVSRNFMSAAVSVGAPAAPAVPVVPAVSGVPAVPPAVGDARGAAFKHPVTVICLPALEGLLCDGGVVWAMIAAVEKPTIVVHMPVQVVFFIGPPSEAPATARPFQTHQLDGAPIAAPRAQPSGPRTRDKNPAYSSDPWHSAPNRSSLLPPDTTSSSPTRERCSFRKRAIRRWIWSTTISPSLPAPFGAPAAVPMSWCGTRTGSTASSSIRNARPNPVLPGSMWSRCTFPPAGAPKKSCRAMLPPSCGWPTWRASSSTPIQCAQTASNALTSCAWISIQCPASRGPNFVPSRRSCAQRSMTSGSSV